SESIIGQLLLIHARVQGPVHLFDVAVSQLIDMSNAEMGELMLTPVLVKSGASRGFIFPPVVDFTGTSYLTLTADIDRFVRVLTSTEPLQLQPLSRVEETLRRAGRNNWADDVYISRRNAEAKYAATAFDRIRYAFMSVFSVYGLRPER